MTVYALRLTNSTDTALRVRVADSLGLNGGGGGLTKARSGVRPGGGVVTVNAGSMSVQVSAFVAWVAGGSSFGQIGYAFASDASTALLIGDGDATLARTDTIAAVVREDSYDGTGETTATLEVIQGVPGAGAPTLPDSCVPLRDVIVPAGLSTGTGGLSASNLGADRRPFLAALGGIIPVSGATERDALDPYAGMPVFRADTGRAQVYDGTEWDTLATDASVTAAVPQAGIVNLPVAKTGTRYTQHVTFPDPYGTPPVVVVTAAVGSPEDTHVCVNNVSATGFDFLYYRETFAGDITGRWMALPAT